MRGLDISQARAIRLRIGFLRSRPATHQETCNDRHRSTRGLAQGLLGSGYETLTAVQKSVIDLIAAEAPTEVSPILVAGAPELSSRCHHRDGSIRLSEPGQQHPRLPHIFRGALDVQVWSINHALKVAAAKALAMLAREDVPDEVAMASQGRKLKCGPDDIIPSPFSTRA